MKTDIREKVLVRDNNKCRCCGSSDNLEVHHIVSKEECDLMGDSGELFKLLNQPDYCITLCTKCHTTTFLQSSRLPLYTIEEKNELKSIAEKSKELLACRQKLKEQYYNLWNAQSYQKKKHQIEKESKELKKRRMEIVKQGKDRLTTLRQQVIECCEDHLNRCMGASEKEGIDDKPTHLTLHPHP